MAAKAKVTIEETARAAGVSMGYLKREMLSHHILAFSNYCDSCDLMGPHLGLTPETISALNEDYHGRTELKRQKLLEKWKQINSFNATYLKFAGALLAYGRADLVYEMFGILAKEEAAGNDKQNGSKDIKMQPKPPTEKVIKLMRFEDLPVINLNIADYGDVLRLVIDMENQWNDLGIALNLPLPVLNSIKIDKESSVRDRMKAVIEAWLQFKGDQPCWQHLCKALRDKLVNREDIAKKVEEKALEKYHNKEAKP